MPNQIKSESSMKCKTMQNLYNKNVQVLLKKLQTPTLTFHRENSQGDLGGERKPGTFFSSTKQEEGHITVFSYSAAPTHIG